MKHLRILPTLLAASLILSGGPAFAGSPRVLKSASDAIQYARTNSQPLILFALIDSSEGSRNFAKLFNDNMLKLESHEFVVAICDASKPENVTLFRSRFEQQPSSLPSVVITNATGSVQAPALNGVQVQDDYDRMIHASLVAAGLRTEEDPVISSTTGEIIEGSSEVFRIRKSDVGMAEKVISPYRNWNLKSGESFYAALLKAEGTMGIMRLDDGGERRINFNDLEQADIDYLTGLLSGS